MSDEFVQSHYVAMFTRRGWRLISTPAHLLHPSLVSSSFPFVPNSPPCSDRSATELIVVIVRDGEVYRGTLVKMRLCDV